MLCVEGLGFARSSDPFAQRIIGWFIPRRCPWNCGGVEYYAGQIYLREVTT